jgi:hypothetical protein
MGTDPEGSPQTTPAPAPVDVPRLARPAQVSPKFFESLSRVGINGDRPRLESTLKARINGDRPRLESALKTWSVPFLLSASGVVTIFTERPACSSCLGVVEQFKSRYSNIRVDVLDNKGVVIRPLKVGQ